MTELVHPCMDTDVFYVDSADTRTHLRLKSGGGLAKTAAGLEVQVDGSSVDLVAGKLHAINEHFFADFFDLVPEPLASGVFNPPSFVLTPWLPIGVIANPSATRSCLFRVECRSDMFLVANGEADSDVNFTLTLSRDGGTSAYNHPVQSEARKSFDLGALGTHEGGFSAQYPSQWIVPPGGSIDLAAIFGAQTVAGAAPVFVQATQIRTRVEGYLQ